MFLKNLGDDFCQAQHSTNSSWAELALLSLYPLAVWKDKLGNLTPYRAILASAFNEETHNEAYIEEYSIYYSSTIYCKDIAIISHA